MTEAPTQALVDGRYRVLDRIGSGGMGDVYRAEDTHLKRDVALKVLHRRFARDEQFVERFRREASSAASLQHPNVVSVYDRGEHDGTYYIAMEHLGGRTLKELVAAEAPLAQERAIDIGIQILQAAGFAHRRGVVHRDFKPQNVIADDRDEIKVTDFGIARAGASDITETGSILGTAQYLSPEQAQGGSVQASSDVYSIGVILYEMLAGRLPFDGDSAVSIAVKHLTEQPPPLSELRPDIHPGLEAAVMKSLVKDPSERWGSAEELVSALQSARAQIAMGEDGQGTAVWAPLPVDGGLPDEGDEDPAERRRRRRRRWSILLGLLLLGGALAAFLLLRGPPQVAVPDVTGEQLADAEPRLEQAGFAVETEKQEDQVPINEVIEQDPESGSEIDEGAAVTLVVSEGPGKAKVPDLVGLPEERALERLERLERRDFTAEIDREPSTDVAAGIVVRTVPGPGERARVGSSVNVVISEGPRQVEVPDVIGETEDTAAVTLESQGLAAAANEVESEQPRGVVVGQEPGAGTTVDEGTEVTISVSLGPPPEPETVRVPNVVGLSQGAAEEELSAAGLEAKAGEQTTEDESEDGVVVSQSPGGGAEVDEGAAVTVVVGRFEAPPEEDPERPDRQDTDPKPPPKQRGEQPGSGRNQRRGR